MNFGIDGILQAITYVLFQKKSVAKRKKMVYSIDTT